jgi:hypothetical protein
MVAKEKLVEEPKVAVLSLTSINLKKKENPQQHALISLMPVPCHIAVQRIKSAL